MSEIFIHYDKATGEILGYGTSDEPAAGRATSAFDIAPGETLIPDPARQKIDLRTGRLVDKSAAERKAFAKLPRLRGADESERFEP